AQRCDALGERESLAHRHAVHYVAMAEQAEPELRRSGQLGWHHRLEAELANLRLAFRWSVRSGAADLALRLAGALWLFWLWHVGHCRRPLSRRDRTIRAWAGDLPPARAGVAACDLGAQPRCGGATCRGRRARRDTVHPQARTGYHDLGDSAYEARAIRHLATC